MKKYLIPITAAVLTVSSLSLQANSATVKPLDVVSSKSASTFFTGNIQLSGRQLLVDGVPFVMKGVCYSPVKKGMMFPDGLITLNPTPDDLVTIEKDFQLMQQAGINTIRTYLPITNAAVLALLTKYNLRTIIPICPGYDFYQNLDAIEQNVELLKNEPSTLIWEIGNEWNLNHFYTYNPRSSGEDQGTSDLSAQQCLDLIQTVANLVRGHDGAHPVSCDISCPSPSLIVSSAQPNNSSQGESGVYQVIPDCVDMIGVNVYHRLDFGSGFKKWNQLTDKPFYIGETGAVAWNANINAEDDDSQALGDRCAAMNIMNNLSAINSSNILVGGCLFEWCDEWWKSGFPLDHDTTGLTLATGPYPGNCYINEWFGILDIDHNPRAAYDAIKSVFNPTPQ